MAILELHACQGLNACNGHGANGTGTQAGDGDCATTNVHTCGGKNNCRGQGGCGYKADPNENACKGVGGCGSPIPEKQIFHPESDQAGNVWDNARKAFEARMNATYNPYAPAPHVNSTRSKLPPT